MKSNIEFRKLQSAALKTMSVAEKIDTCERESRDILDFNPGYSREYLKRKLGTGYHDFKKSDP
jgi:hypothetical protein